MEPQNKTLDPIEVQKIKNIHLKVRSELETELENSRKKDGKLNFRSFLIQQKILDLAKFKCESTLQWFYTNSDMVNQGFQFKINNEKEEEAMKYIGEFENCLDSVDYGFRQSVEKTYLLSNKNTEQFQQCLKFCVANYQSDRTDDTKKCFNECYLNSLENSKKINSFLSERIDEIMDKI